MYIVTQFDNTRLTKGRTITGRFLIIGQFYLGVGGGADNIIHKLLKL